MTLRPLYTHVTVFRKPNGKAYIGHGLNDGGDNLLTNDDVCNLLSSSDNPLCSGVPTLAMYISGSKVMFME